MKRICCNLTKAYRIFATFIESLYKNMGKLPEKFQESSPVYQRIICSSISLVYVRSIEFITLTLACLSCEFAFRAHFQCVVGTYGLKCVENANQLVSTQGKIHEYSCVLGSVSALTNQNCLF